MPNRQVCHMVNGKVYSAEGLRLFLLTLFCSGDTPAMYVRHKTNTLIASNLAGQSCTVQIDGTFVTVRPIYVTLKRHDT